ncbi:MAG: biopolymer transporter ExbD [Rhodoferax sp.]|nr:biopolymer transporter ExbD [Rhodoferax sp.]MCF8210050.1 biopolymer transporter ExbD [Rhodoferax sp.]
MSFGRLERTPAPQPMSEINMTPLVDVMLVLVVIFILTAPLLVGAVKVDLPKAESTGSMESPQFVSLSITKAGVVFVGEQAVALQALTQTLKEAAQRNPETEVQLRADAAVPYGRVVEVMGAAHKAGLYRIGFVAEPAPAR